MTSRSQRRRSAPAVLTGTIAWRVYWHCLTLQASWNEQRLQNLGLLAALASWLRRLPLTPAQRRSVCRRYFGYFNTNPYLAGYIIGGLLHLEQGRAQGQEISEREVGRLRDTLAGVCGALGDQIFWLGLRPAIMLTACFLAVFARWELIIAHIGAFTAAQLWWRWRSLAAGYALGMQVVEVIGQPAWHRTIVRARAAALALTGAVIGVYFAGVGGPGEAVGSGRLLGLFCLGFGLPLLVRQKISAELQLLLGLGGVGLLVLVVA